MSKITIRIEELKDILDFYHSMIGENDTPSVIEIIQDNSSGIGYTLEAKIQVKLQKYSQPVSVATMITDESSW